MEQILVTGAAGFIGAAVCQALIERGNAVLGIDNLSDYYDVSLKEARLARLKSNKFFSFRKADIADKDAILALGAAGFTGIVHLAAQPGVRYSLENPYAYVSANVMGQAVMLALARASAGLKHFVYASSSSVYGANKKTPFAIGDAVDHPNSLYAATKRADELFGHTYAHLYGIPCTGLRFFTVYGPWGRPDMAPWLFTEAIIAGKPIKLFNHGKMRRDFTYIDDIVAGVIACLDKPPPADAKPPYRLYNIGNSVSEELTRFVAILEAAIGKSAIIERAPMPPGDIEATYADISATTRDFGFMPKTALAEGLPRFVQWYRDHHKV